MNYNHRLVGRELQTARGRFVLVGEDGRAWYGRPVGDRSGLLYRLSVQEMSGLIDLK
jgi:hypothetical protein